MPKSKEFLSSSESDSDEEQPKPKKKKVEKPKKEKKEEEVKDSSGVRGKNGEMMFQLSRMRYATVSEFRGKVMVSIREYYEAEGELRPGKKGISLSLEQWNKLKELTEEIDDEIKTH
ncbi:activated RNA polymerase II transcriptional coactivator p15-like [Liolophura sinensis]|uniref:activated RNA polymerase II transcriptional coactivator p15-like n=1 Tax=Liolophura sinensis TaxID=3198878 RepID=UPI00315947F6